MVEISDEVFSATLKDDLNEFMEIRMERVTPETMSEWYTKVYKEQNAIMEKVRGMVPRETYFGLV